MTFLVIESYKRKLPGLLPSICLPVLLLCCCIVPVRAQAADDGIDATLNPAFRSFYRPGSPLPLRIAFSNKGSDRSGTATITASTVRYHSTIALPAPTVRRLTIDPVFYANASDIAVKIVRGETSVFEATLKPATRPVDDKTLLAGVLGDPSRFRDVKRCLGDAEFTSIEWLPEQSAEQYEALDLILVDASRPGVLPRPPNALVGWLECGGSILVSLPEDPAATGLWATFVRSNISRQTRHTDWLSSFSLGLGRVVTVRNPDGPRLGDPEWRKACAQKIADVLDVRLFPRLEPVQPDLYAPLRPPLWEESRRFHLAALIGLYILLTVVVLIWSGSTRRTWTAAGGISAAFTMVLCFMLFDAREAPTTRSMALLRAVAGDSHARVDSYLGLGTQRRKLDTTIATTARPVFYDWADAYEMTADVDLDNETTGGIHLTRETWRCFASWRAVTLRGVSRDAETLRMNAILNGEELNLHDALVVDGNEATFAGDIQGDLDLSAFKDPRPTAEAIRRSLPIDDETGDTESRREFLEWWLERKRHPGRRLIAWAKSRNIGGRIGPVLQGSPTWVMIVLEIPREAQTAPDPPQD